MLAAVRKPYGLSDNDENFYILAFESVLFGLSINTKAIFIMAKLPKGSDAKLQGLKAQAYGSQLPLD